MTLAVAILLASGLAHAEPTARDRALAESIFREAKKRFQAGDIAAACSSFAESQRLDPQLGALLHLATCHEKEGKLATAWIEFTEAAQRADAPKQKERRELARAKADELESRVPRLVVVARAKDQVLTLDGERIADGSLDVPMPLDPGEHVLQASAAGKKTWTQIVTLVPDAERVTVVVPELDDLAPPAPPIAVAPPVAVDAGPTDGPTKIPPRTLGYVVGGIGLASIATGAYLGVLMVQRKSSAETGCVGRFCTQEALDRFDEARTQGVLSTVLVGVGVAAVAAGVVLFVSSPSSQTSQNTPRGLVRVAPIASPGGLGVSMSGTL